MKRSSVIAQGFPSLRKRGGNGCSDSRELADLDGLPEVGSGQTNTTERVDFLVGLGHDMIRNTNRQVLSDALQPPGYTHTPKRKI